MNTGVEEWNKLDPDERWMIKHWAGPKGNPYFRQWFQKHYVQILEAFRVISGFMSIGTPGCYNDNLTYFANQLYTMQLDDNDELDKTTKKLMDTRL